jgi:hypothetical protein
MGRRDLVEKKEEASREESLREKRQWWAEKASCRHAMSLMLAGYSISPLRIW